MCWLSPNCTLHGTVWNTTVFYMTVHCTFSHSLLYFTARCTEPSFTMHCTLVHCKQPTLFSQSVTHHPLSLPSYLTALTYFTLDCPLLYHVHSTLDLCFPCLPNLTNTWTSKAYQNKSKKGNCWTISKYKFACTKIFNAFNELKTKALLNISLRKYSTL